MTRVLKERTFSGTTNPEAASWENEHRQIAREAADEGIVSATTEYSTHIHASVEQGNVFACQFHPEKSSDIGIQILKNFVEL